MFCQYTFSFLACHWSSGSECGALLAVCRAAPVARTLVPHQQL